MKAVIAGKKINLDPQKAIGKGGEADVFQIGANIVAKIFKKPGHPDFAGMPIEQHAAKMRILEHQQKLLLIPKGLPERIVMPEELITDEKDGTIIGYAMRYITGSEVLLRYGERLFREKGIDNQVMSEILIDLHKSVTALHKAQVVIGDFNDLNVLVNGKAAYLIDTDSYQFARFMCKMFTAKFADPLLYKIGTGELAFIGPHNTNSDWYAFAVMLIQSLLFVDPYGGVYRPLNKGKMIPHVQRPLKRITIFNPDVRYPKPAIPFKVLGDDLLHYLREVFEKDKREEFPLKLLENFRWTKCTKCGTEHARNACPNCAEVTPAAVKEAVAIRGSVTSTRVFKTDGVILFATEQDGKLLWLCHEDGTFKREGGSVVAKGTLDPGIRFRLREKETLLGKNGQVVALSLNQADKRFAVDSYGNLPIFDANEKSVYWVKNGQLQRNGELGPEYIGDVLSDQTLFWVGKEFGFGFYRAGNLNTAFVFDAVRHGIYDSVKLPSIRGQLVDSTCVFGHDRAWFFVATQEGGKTMRQVIVIRKNGEVEASIKVEANEEDWLNNIRGKCAAGNFLLAATDEGIVRVEVDNGKISKTRTFPDTEPFVNSGCHLFPGRDGLYVVSGKEIKHLKMR